jgi:hypothetical protein
VRGAGDAGIVVPDGLLAAPCERIPGQGEQLRHQFAQIVLDAALVLGGGRDDPRFLDEALRVDPIAVIQKPPWSLAGPKAGPRPDLEGLKGAIRRLITVDEAQGLLAGVDDLDAADEKAAEGVAPGGVRPMDTATSRARGESWEKFRLNRARGPTI